MMQTHGEGTRKNKRESAVEKKGERQGGCFLKATVSENQ